MLLNVDFPTSIHQLWISPGGTRLAVANYDQGPGEVLVIELPSGKQVARYRPLNTPPYAAFRSESELVIAHGHECWLCDLATASHRVVGRVEGWLACCRPTPDGTSVALGRQRGWGLFLLDLEAESKPWLLSDQPRGLIENITFSPDGCFAAVMAAPEAGDREWQVVQILDAQSGKVLRQLKLPEHQGFMYSAAFHQSSRALAVGWLSNVLLFDLDPPESPLDPEVLFGGDSAGFPMGWARPTARYPLDREREGDLDVRKLWFSADGSVLKVVCDHGDAVLMSSKDGQVLQRTPPPTDSELGSGADISQGGRVAMHVGEGAVLTWEVPWWGEA